MYGEQTTPPTDDLPAPEFIAPSAAPPPEDVEPSTRILGSRDSEREPTVVLQPQVRWQELAASIRSLQGDDTRSEQRGPATRSKDGLPMGWAHEEAQRGDRAEPGDAKHRVARTRLTAVFVFGCAVGSAALVTLHTMLRDSKNEVALPAASEPVPSGRDPKAESTPSSEHAAVEAARVGKPTLERAEVTLTAPAEPTRPEAPPSESVESSDPSEAPPPSKTDRVASRSRTKSRSRRRTPPKSRPHADPPDEPQPSSGEKSESEPSPTEPPKKEWHPGDDLRDPW